MIQRHEHQSDLLRHWIDYEKLFRTIAGVRGAGVFILTITVDILQSKPCIGFSTTKTLALNLLSISTLDQSVMEMPSNYSLQTSQIGHPCLHLVFSIVSIHPRVKFLIIIIRIPKDLSYIGFILKINKLFTLDLILK
jgi:hypothetical protein